MRAIKPLSPAEQAEYDKIMQQAPGTKPRNARKDARRKAQGKPSIREWQQARSKAAKDRATRVLESKWHEGYAAGLVHEPGDPVPDPYFDNFVVTEYGAAFERGFKAALEGRRIWKVFETAEEMLVEHNRRIK